MSNRQLPMKIFWKFSLIIGALMAHPRFKMHPVYKQVSTVKAQSLACLSGAELTVEIIKNQTLSVLVNTFTSLRLGSGMVSVQPQLLLEAVWTLVLLFLIFQRWQGLKEDCPIGM